MRSQLSICTFLPSEPLAQSLEQFLSGERYILTQLQSKEDFLNFVESRKQQIDCLILQDVSDLVTVVNHLYDRGTLLPSVILKENKVARVEFQTPETEINESTLKPNFSNNSPASSSQEEEGFYHSATVFILGSQLNKIGDYIDQAITQFLELSSEVSFCDRSSIVDTIATNNFLLQHQRRLAEKLRERLGYLGVYYKRNPNYFFRHLSPEKKQEFLEMLKVDYREIVLTYFLQDSNLNQIIDQFVNTAFFSDIPVTHIVEIHMELMDDLSKQLKLEGRSDEVLLDYRLTLIDVIAHLCEMYRRSLPRES